MASANVLQSVNPVTSVLDLASATAVNFVRFPQTTSSQMPATCEDGLHLYAVELLTLSLLWYGFHDAVKEGDGERIVRYWKFLLVIFKSQTTRIMLKRQCTFYFNITTYFLRGKKLNLLGVVQLSKRKVESCAFQE